MLEKAFNDVYTKFKLHFYQNVFQRFATREATLTTVESFCMEGIMAMGEPTIAEFSRMMQISTPNAAYKIGSLVRKGHHRPPGVSPAAHPEVYRLLQHQLLLPEHGGPAGEQALPQRGREEAGTDADHHQQRADARAEPGKQPGGSGGKENRALSRTLPETPEARAPTRAARQDCPTEMWSSPVFFCRNGPCGQQKSPGGLAGPSGARQRRAGPLPQGIAINMRFWGSNFLGESQRNVMHGPKGQRGVCPGPLGVGVQCWDL